MTIFKTAVSQFAKAPVAGQVKTRLCSRYTAEQALAIHCALVENILAQLHHGTQQCQHKLEIDYALWCSEPHRFFDGLSSKYGVNLYMQQGVDLGQRLAHSAECALQNHHAVILIGSDCPYLTGMHLQQVILQLKETSTDAVIIPAEDGGYVLLGLKKTTPYIFDHIAWGSDQVCMQTLAGMKQAKYTCIELPALSDIDFPQDFKNLCLQKTEYLDVLNKI